MEHEHLRIVRDGALGFVVIDRVDKRNAFSLDMWQRIPALVAALEEDADVQIIIFKGADPTAFASGVDIEEFKTIASSKERALDLMNSVHNAGLAISNCTKPSIAMIRGICVGGGVELALACDLRFASSTARFAVPPAKLGLVYTPSSTARLVGLIGSGNTRDLLYSARSFDGEEALRLGLVERCFSPEDTEPETVEYANMLCTRSQYTIRGSKKIIDAICRGEPDDSLAIEELRLESLSSSNLDLAEGVRAFFEKRPPQFRWR